MPGRNQMQPEQDRALPPFLHDAGNRVIDSARGLVGYTFAKTRGGHWASVVVSYNLRLADLLEEIILAADCDLRWSCQLLLRTIADTWLYGRYVIAGDDPLPRMFSKWNKHIDEIAEENQDIGVPTRALGAAKNPPSPKHIAILLDEREPPEDRVFPTEVGHAAVVRV